jgi:hypothetical protein
VTFLFLFSLAVSDARLAILINTKVGNISVWCDRTSIKGVPIA